MTADGLASPEDLPLNHVGPHVLASDLESCAIDDGDHHHLARVLRLRAGDPVTLTDGRGAWRTGRFGPSIEPTSTIAQAASPQPELTVGFALVKSAKPALIVQKLTEIGVDRIRPFRAERSVAQWDEAKARKSHERLERVAREALMQSKGVWLPAVVAVAAMETLIDQESTRGGDLMRADFAGSDLANLSAPRVGSAGPVVLVGPEGGWTDAERTLVPEAISLGATVLRAETACISAGVLLSACRRAWTV